MFLAVPCRWLGNHFVQPGEEPGLAAVNLAETLVVDPGELEFFVCLPCDGHQDSVGLMIAFELQKEVPYINERGLRLKLVMSS